MIEIKLMHYGSGYAEPPRQAQEQAMFTKIFCPVDGSEISNRGQAAAIRLAQEQRAALRFFHATDLGPTLLATAVTEEVFEQLRGDGQALLDRAVAAARAQGVAAEGQLAEIINQRAGTLIVDEATAFGADLIVMGTHGRRGLGKLLIGSDANTVIGTCQTALLLIK